MMHPDEGTLLALRDGEPVTETDRAHIMACGACLADLEDARARADLIGQFLGGEEPSVDLERAKIAVRGRLDGRSSSRVVASSLRRAAAILLVAAGAVAALQSPPVRTWLTERVSLPVDAPDEPVPTRSDDVRSIGVPARADLLIAVAGAEVGASVAIVFEERVEVEVSAAEGTRFAFADGRVDVAEAVGPIVIRIPDDAPSLTITADGRMVFQGTASEHDVAPSAVQADGGWVYRIPER